MIVSSFSACSFQVRTLTVTIDTGVTQLKEKFAAVRVDDLNDRQHQQEEKLRRDIIAWLSTTDPSTNHVEQRRKHQAMTGAWLIESKELDKWRTTPNSFIWLHGTCELLQVHSKLFILT